jgi:hypothetical protein
LAGPGEFGGEAIQVVDPGEFAEVGQYVEDPVVPHDTLFRIG